LKEEGTRVKILGREEGLEGNLSDYIIQAIWKKWRKMCTGSLQINFTINLIKKDFKKSVEWKQR